MTTFTTEDRIAVQQGTPEWHQLRLGKVTASRVADILAKTKTGPSASRQNYLIELAIQRTTGVIEESYSNAAMEWGTLTEPQARVAYEVNTHNFVDQVAFVDHPTIAGFGCSPDGIVGEGLIEIKCPNSATHWSYVKAKAPPTKYFIQMQAQIACTGAKWCDFVSFDPRMPERSQLLVVNVPRDEAFIEEMEAEIKQFLSEVEVEVNQMKGM
ncbi:phage_rel_nuc, putative phage-type endonuclease [uncultured Caudovirales phage]|uniref:Phage_rel_nuc, putative phage-type endonuclease n=1 Tax=uncultured Caudovirales phage TaxID=2100421 RepID=A0A6J7WJT9_9CAUD|nr:phage_rel_nuc, putative phage-type endonuclease [uncultured Caudovirales phage]